MTYPYPEAFTFVNGKKLTVWSADPLETRNMAPGEIRVGRNGVLIGARGGALRLISVDWRGRQLKGRTIFSALREFSTVNV